MTVESETYTVSLDGSENPESLTLNPPNGPGGSSVWRWAVIMNLTPYVALMAQTDDTGVNIVSLAPGTQNKYNWSNLRGPLKISQWINPLPSDTPPPGIPQIVAQFSDNPDGSDFAGNYPSAIQSALNIGTITGDVTLSGPVDINTVAGTVTVDGTVGITGTPNVNITNASIPVTGTVNANITNASVAVTGTVSLSAGTAVVVSNDVTVTPSGTINVQGVAGGTAIGIAGTVSISTGTVDIGTVAGNVTVQEIIDIVGIAGECDLLGSFSGSSGGAATLAGNVVAVNPYTSLIFVYVATSGAASACEFAWAQDTTIASTNSPAFQSAMQLGPGGIPQGIVAMSNKAGDTIAVQVGFSAAFNGTVYVFGSTSLQPPLYRADGRAYPVGKHFDENLFSTTGATVVAAPAGSYRLFIYSISLAPVNAGAATGNNGRILATINGNVHSIASAMAFAAGVTQSDLIFPQGLLCDPGTALTSTYSGTATASFAPQVGYDIVF